MHSIIIRAVQIYGNDFIMSPSSAPDTSIVGQSTVITYRQTLTGDFIRKTSRLGVCPTTWLADMGRAKSISDQVRALNNPAYNVPRTYISHGKVYEEIAPGTKMRDLPKSYTQQNSDWQMPSMAHFINDMSELRPVFYIGQNDRVGNMNLYDVNCFLSQTGGMLASQDQDLIRSIFMYLCALPENSQMVVSHNDLHGGNIVVDALNRRLSFIDFEMAGPASKLSVLYSNVFGGNALWEYINELPRKTNPELQWDYDFATSYMYKLFYIAAPYRYTAISDVVSRLLPYLNIVKQIPNLGQLLYATYTHHHR